MSHVENRKMEIAQEKAIFARHEQIGGPEGVIRLTWFMEEPDAGPSIESLKFLRRYLNLRLKTMKPKATK